MTLQAGFSKVRVSEINVVLNSEQDELLAFGAFVESARAWGRAQRVALGV